MKYCSLLQVFQFFFCCKIAETKFVKLFDAFKANRNAITLGLLSVLFTRALAVFDKLFILSRHTWFAQHNHSETYEIIAFT